MPPKLRPGSVATDDPSPEMEELINKVCARLETKLSKKIDDMAKTVTSKIDDLQRSFSHISALANTNLESIKSLEQKVEMLEQHTKKNSLRLNGVTEEQNEDVLGVVKSIFKNYLKVSCNTSDFDSIFRVGKSDNIDRPRTILVNFSNNIIRSAAYAAKKSLKGSGYSLFEDLSKVRYELLVAAKKKYGNNMAWSASGKIFVWCNQQNKKRPISSVNDL